MNNVTPIWRCKCGATGSSRELVLNEEHIADFVGCDSCVGSAVDVLDRIRPVFEAMITAGIDRDAAKRQHELPAAKGGFAIRPALSMQ